MDQAAEKARQDEQLQPMLTRLKARPNDAALLRSVSNFLLDHGRYAEADRFVRQWVTAHPSDGFAYLATARLLAGVKRAGDALRFAIRAFELLPGELEPMLVIARLYDRLERPHEAEQAYLRAISSFPDDPSPRLKLAELLIAHGEFAGARKQIEGAFEIFEDSSEAHLLMAQVLNAAQESEQAEWHLERSVSLDRDNSVALTMLGYRRQSRGDFSGARELFRRAVALDPTQAMAYYGIAQGRRFTEEDRPFIDKLQLLVRDSRLPLSDQMTLRYGLGKAFEDLRNYEAAMEQFDLANQLAFKVNLGGRPFRASQYHDLVTRTIESYSREAMAEAAKRGHPSRVPIFVVGMMRSGTTLVEQILSSHPEIGGAGERDFWLDNVSATLDIAKLAELGPRYLEELTKACPGKSRVIDKMPQNFQVLGAMYTAFPSATIIHVRRHPVDNALSIYTTPYQQSPEYAHVRGSIVEAYREYQRLTDHWRSAIQNVLEIAYEDLILAPETTIRKMIAACGLAWNDACLHHEANDRAVNTPSMWQVRQPLYGSSVARWRRFEPWLGDLAELANDH